METVSALLALCVRNSLVTGEYPSQRPATQSFEDFFEIHPNKRLIKEWRRRWLETQSYPLWRHCNEVHPFDYIIESFRHYNDSTSLTIVTLCLICVKAQADQINALVTFTLDIGWVMIRQNMWMPRPNLSLEAEEISVPECKLLSLPMSGENSDRCNPFNKM